MVVDNDINGIPVPNVEITLTPVDMVQRIDTNGICIFEVEPGNYFIDIEVCCVGPGNIEYHFLVKIILLMSNCWRAYPVIKAYKLWD
jgi:hypothetical protein